MIDDDLGCYVLYTGVVFTECSALSLCQLTAAQTISLLPVWEQEAAATHQIEGREASIRPPPAPLPPPLRSFTRF